MVGGRWPGPALPLAPHRRRPRRKRQRAMPRLQQRRKADVAPLGSPINYSPGVWPPPPLNRRHGKGWTTVPSSRAIPEPKVTDEGRDRGGISSQKVLPRGLVRCFQSQAVVLDKLGRRPEGGLPSRLAWAAHLRRAEMIRFLGEVSKKQGRWHLAVNNLTSKGPRARPTVLVGPLLWKTTSLGMAQTG